MTIPVLILIAAGVGLTLLGFLAYALRSWCAHIESQILKQEAVHGMLQNRLASSDKKANELSKSLDALSGQMKSMELEQMELEQRSTEALHARITELETRNEQLMGALLSASEGPRQRAAAISSLLHRQSGEAIWEVDSSEEDELEIEEESNPSVVEGVSWEVTS
jgi:hypothetical protein